MSHRRRGVGVGRAAATKYKKKAEEIKAVSHQSALETVEKLQVKLKEFAKKHRLDIQQDAAFRQKFLQMCGPLGVDPLVSTKSFWAKALGVGMGDFYYELAVKIAEICYATKSKNGGIISISEVHDILTTRTSKTTNKKNQYAKSDIPIAISKLAKLGGGFRTIKVGTSEMIVSVPTELDQDHMEIMSLAQQQGSGCITADEVIQKTSWSKQRTNRAITLLLQEGMAWQDDYHGISFYWIPSIWKENNDL